MTRFIFLFILITAAKSSLYSQQFDKKERPRLIVGIVTDQMRYDYLYRFWNQYSEGGIKKLLRQGFSCENTHFNYSPTYTGPGHAAIYTGTVPAVNGIVGNNWLDPGSGRDQYVTTDTTRLCVGCASPTHKDGRHAPTALLTTTITDELRLSSNFRSKVVSVCMKDRGAILPAGRLANGCYWFHDETGAWVTSDFYEKKGVLPDWLKRFNEQKLADKYLSGQWTPLYPPTESIQDYSTYFATDRAGGKFFDTGFPYDLSAMRQKRGYGLIRNIPAGNTLTLDLALEALKAHRLGQGADPDFLCISFSPNDYCAHKTGIRAAELEDMYLRFDREIERLINYLEANFGKDQFLLFLTADHGACETPQHMQTLGFPYGAISEKSLKNQLNGRLQSKFNCKDTLIRYIGNQQIWLDDRAIQKNNLDFDQALDYLAGELRRIEGVYQVYRVDELQRLSDAYPFMRLIQRGIYPKRCGHLFFQLEPGWHDGLDYLGNGGTTHGSTYPYDTHVPLLWYGWRIQPGETHERIEITDIAPTVAAMLRIAPPSGCSGKPIVPLLQNLTKK